jgi:predicted O-methyltransferase YrrM
MLPIQKLEIINDYIAREFAQEPAVLQEYAQRAVEKKIYQVQVPSDVGKLLQILVKATGARQVLEVGTLWGYSAWWINQALPDDGQLITIEKFDKHAVFARDFFAQEQMDQVELLHTDALEALTSFDDDHFDFVFIDADKKEYPQYLVQIERVLKPGGMLVADNVFYSSNWNDVTTAEDTDDPRIASARAFNASLAESPQWMALPLAIQQGVMIALKQ